MKRPTGPSFRRRFWAVGALAILAIVAAACDGDSRHESTSTLAATGASSTTAATTTTKAPVATGQRELAAVLEFIDAYNAGDFQTMQSAVDPSSQAGWSHEGQHRSADEIFINANRRITVVEPCELAAASVVTCTLAEVNDWHRAAGLTFEAVSRFHLNGELRIVNWTDNWECCAAQIPFHWAFWEWFEVEHPDIYATIAPQTSDGLPGLTTDPAHMTVALAHVGDFITQSDVYPIGSDG